MASERRAVVIKGAQIPLPVPAGYVDVAAQQRGVRAQGIGPLRVAAVTQRRETVADTG